MSISALGEGSPKGEALGFSDMTWDWGGKGVPCSGCQPSPAREAAPPWRGGAQQCPEADEGADHSERGQELDHEA